MCEIDPLLNHDSTPVSYWNKVGFVLCTAGEAEVVINEQSFRLNRGGIFLVTPLVQVAALRSSADYQTISFVDELKVFYPIFRLIADTKIPLNVRNIPCWRIDAPLIDCVTAQVERIRSKRRRLAETASSDEQRLLRRQILLLQQETMLEIVVDHTRRFPVRADRQSDVVAVAYRFLLGLQEHYRQERSVAWYAAEAGLSAGHFATLIKRATGKSPSAWIAIVTISYAKRLLEQEGRSIKEIARELHFPEQFTFRKYFKHHTGLSPKAYRQKRGVQTVR